MNKFISDKLRILSFILIIFVVFVHAYTFKKANPFEVNFQDRYSWFVEEFVTYGLVRVAVPLFFAISGYLFFLSYKATFHDFLLKCKKRVKTLLIPYLFWSIYGIVFFLVIQAVPKVGRFFSAQLVRNYSVGKFLDTIFINPIPYQLWFLRDLMLIVLISPLLYYLITKLRFAVVILAFICWFVDVKLVVLSSESLLFFVLGSYLAIRKIELYHKKLSGYAIFTTILWLAIILVRIFAVKEQWVTMFENMLLYKLSIVVGLFAMWILYDRLVPQTFELTEKNKTWLSFSFFIYLFHEPILTIIKKISFSVLSKTDLHILMVYFMSGVLAIITSLTVGYLLKRWFLKLYDFATGNR